MNLMKLDSIEEHVVVLDFGRRGAVRPIVSAAARQRLAPLP
jgi:hypothetical protein